MTYPATLTFDAPERVSRWRPLVQWILAIPHFIISYLIGIVAMFALFVAWFAIVLTGKMPGGIANFVCMTIRYQTRIGAYVGFLHGEYPPFQFDMTATDPGGHPIRVDFEPALEGRSRLTVLFRFIWVIPAMLFGMLIYIVAEILWFLAFFAVLFTGKWPTSFLSFITGSLRVMTRYSAYGNLLTDEYPPFATD